MAEVVEPDLVPDAAIVPTPTPGSPAAPPAEASIDPDEAEAVELPAGKHVPLSALKSAREELKATKAALQAAQGDVQFAQQNRPVLTFLQQHPEILRPQQAPAATPATGPDPQLTELARALDYYKTDGTPDLDRAAKFNTILNARAMEQARAMVDPIAGSILHEKSEQNWRAAVSEKLPNGQAIDVSLLTSAWQDVLRYPNAGQILADPRAVKVIVNTVKMQQLESGGQLPAQPAAPNQPPVRTEPQGAQPRGPRNVMTDAEKAIVGSRMDDKKYHEYTKDFRPGRPNILEDN